jgi:hypothetical protein
MSIQNINIARDNVEGKCDLKCSYNFKYNESNTTAKNDGIEISLTYDNSNTSPVTYNTQKYNVSKITIMRPSIHMFDGALAAGELCIEHTPVKGGPNLMVGIPIRSSSESSSASTLVTEIINNVAANAPASGDSTNLNIQGFTLENIVPKKPFYSYTESESSEWIVFDILDAIPLSSSTLKVLGKIIQPFPIPTTGRGLFYNSSGPNSLDNLGDGIYISCKPTGNSVEEIPVEYSKNESTNDLSNIFKNKTFLLIFQVIIGCIVFIVILLLLNYVYNYITTGESKFPSFSSNQNQGSNS